MSEMQKSAKSSNSMLIIAAAVLLAVAVGVFIYMQQQPSGEQKEDSVQAEATKALPANILGKKDAPVTIIEYSSMTCPHCAVFHNTTLPDLKKQYIDTGKVKYVLREFPLDNLAAAAFMLGRCLPKRENYFDFIDILYAQQGSWLRTEDGPLKPLKKISLQAGFTEKSFTACLDDKKLFAQIIAVKNNGSREHQIRSTPTFFINGQRLEGAQPLAEFAKVIDPLLAK